MSDSGKVRPIDTGPKRSARTRTRPPAGEEAPKDIRDAAQAAAPEESRRTPKDRKLVASLAQFYGVIGVSLSGVGQATGNMGLAVAGVNIAAKGEDAAGMWVDLAEKSPAVRRALEGFAEGSALAGVIGIHATMLAPIVLSVRQDRVPPMVAQMAWNACLADEARIAAVAFGMTTEPATPPQAA